MTTAAANPRAFAVWFKDLDRCDPASFGRIVWHWPKEIMRPIGSFLRPRKEKVDLEQIAFADLQPLTIHFDGSIDRRKMDGNRAYTMDLFFARPGDVVVAKIDLKNGAVAIVPEWDDVAVTGHFAVYEPNRSKVLPEYFHCVIQAGFFKDHLWRNKVGAEGRKEVKLDFFEALEIPLPPLPVQRAIVRWWQDAQTESAKAAGRADKLEAAVGEEVLKRLGIAASVGGDLLPKVFALWWKHLERWGVEFNRRRTRCETVLNSSHYRMVTLPEVAFVNPTARMRAMTGEASVSFVPMEAVSEDSGSIIGPVDRSCRDVQKGYTRFENGDVIWAKITPCMQNGKCAVASGLASGVGFGSTEFHVIRPRPEKMVTAEYVWVLLRLDALLRCAEKYFIGSAGQQRVPPSFLQCLRIPLPPLDVQRGIVDLVNKRRAEIAAARQSAAKLSADVAQEVEEMILGTRPVEARAGTREATRGQSQIER